VQTPINKTTNKAVKFKISRLAKRFSGQKESLTSNHQRDVSLSLSLYECTMLRGVAILLIILHNFCHLLPTAVPENEFNFVSDRSVSMLNELINPSVGVINHLFSYFGHYGVSIFIFLSGYGLVQKYEKSAVKTTFIKYTWHNAKKLWGILIPGTILFACVTILIDQEFSFTNKFIYYQLVFLANPFPYAKITPFIFWYVGMAMQLYFVYYVALRNRSNKLLLCAVAFQMVSQWITMRFLEGTWFGINWLSTNFPAWLIPFSAGIYVGRKGLPDLLVKHENVTLFTVLLVFIAGQYVSCVWPFSGVCFVYLMVRLTFCLERGVMRRFVYWVGSISMMIYMIHPSTRSIFYRLSPTITSYHILALYLIATLFLSWLANIVRNRLLARR
jgi:peptidoglycan/LPS O-acetylase OafA/YrhL